jgi:hypothetical protein
MNLKIMYVPEKLKQEDFGEYISKRGYRCIRLLKKNDKQIKEEIRKLPNYFDIWDKINEFLDFDLEECYKEGSPDFIIFKEDKFYICEFKSLSDGLRTSQIKWLDDHSDLPLILIIAIK